MVPLARILVGSLLLTSPVLGQAAPWARTHAYSSLEAGHDDQPITFIRPTVAVWGFVSNWTSIGARASATAFRLADTASRSTADIALTFSQTFRAGGVTLDGDIGAVHRSWSDATENIGSLRLIAKPAAWSTISVRAERVPYTSTELSLTTPVMTWRYTGNVAGARRGWNGEAGIQQTSFPSFGFVPSGANDVTSVYAWALAPLAPAEKPPLQVGYSFAMQDSRKLMYTLARPGQSAPPSSANFDFTGIYSPYYTPRNVRVHSVIAAASNTVDQVSIHMNGAYGFSATEDSPVIASAVATPRGPGAVVAEIPRAFHPWNARVSLASTVARNVTVIAAVEALRTAFYHAQTASLSLDYTIGK